MHRRNRSGREKGLALAELACGSIFIMVLLMVAIDITLMMLGFQLNDRACRAATRAAAQQSTRTKALAAVNAALSMYRGDGVFVGTPILSPATNALIYTDFGGTPNSGNPTVSVCTEVTVKVPVPLVFFGQSFGMTPPTFSTSWTFQKRYTYPILDVALVLS